MKSAFKKLTLALTIAILFVTIRLNFKTFPYKLWHKAQAQTLQFNKQQRLLEVAIRESVIVRVGQSGSYTGKLIGFNSGNLTIESQGFSQTIPFSKIEEVTFQGDIFLEGERIKPPIRGIKILADLPVTALKLDNPPIKASLSLKTMSDQGFARFSSDENCPCTISTITFHNQEKMTVKLEEIE